MRARVVHFSLVGFHSSAASTRSSVGAVLNPLALVPPVTSTVPSASKVAFICRRATAIDATERHVPVPDEMSITSAVLVGEPPPRVRTSPLASEVFVGYQRPFCMSGPDVQLLVR